MSISYSGLVGYGKAILPSIDTWGTNHSIIKEPPKAVTTKRIERVTDTSRFLRDASEDPDRICENINIFARGVNPSVSVSYNNTGSTPAYLTHRVGELKPEFVQPIKDRALSRQARSNISQTAPLASVNYAKQVYQQTCSENTPGAKKDAKMIRTFIRPTAVMKYETPLKETYEVRNVIQNPLKVSASSGIRTMNRTSLKHMEPSSGIHKIIQYSKFANPSQFRQLDPQEINTDPFTQDILQVSAKSNPSLIIHVEQGNDLDQNRYTHDVLTAKVQSNPYQSRGGNVEEQLGYTPIDSIQDSLHVDYKTPVKWHEKVEYLDTEHDLDRNLPIHSITTNTGTGKSGSIDTISSRDFKLIPTINPGSFEGRAGIPSIDRGGNDRGMSLQSEKTLMARKIMEMQTGRR